MPRAGHFSDTPKVARPATQAGAAPERSHTTPPATKHVDECCCGRPPRHPPAGLRGIHAVGGSVRAAHARVRTLAGGTRRGRSLPEAGRQRRHRRRGQDAPRRSGTRRCRPASARVQSRACRPVVTGRRAQEWRRGGAGGGRVTRRRGAVALRRMRLSSAPACAAPDFCRNRAAPPGACRVFPPRGKQRTERRWRPLCPGTAR